MSKPLAVVPLLIMVSVSHAEMPHNRRCDIAQDKPEPGGGSEIMFGLCRGIEDLPTGTSTSLYYTWNAYNCGYQAYRQGKAFEANPYYNEKLEERWNTGWKDAEKACKSGKGPFDD